LRVERSEERWRGKGEIGGRRVPILLQKTTPSSEVISKAPDLGLPLELPSTSISGKARSIAVAHARNLEPYPAQGTTAIHCLLSLPHRTKRRDPIVDEPQAVQYSMYIFMLLFLGFGVSIEKTQNDQDKDKATCG
jgi:hypothetical protein